MSSAVVSLAPALKAIYYTKLVNVGAFAILVYDYCLTIGREKELLWNASFGFGKLLLLTIRYLTLASMTFIIGILFTPQVKVETCLVWSKFEWLIGITIVILTELALQLRLYAMYDKSRYMLVILVISFLSTFGAVFVLVCKIVIAEGDIFLTFLPLADSFICVPTNVPSYYRDVWIPVFVHEVFLMILAVFRGIQSSRNQGTDGYVSRFTMFLVKDSVLYYFAVFGVFFSMELIWVILGVNYIELPFGLTIIVASIMCQRMLLHIREEYQTHRKPVPSRIIDDESIMLSTMGLN